MDRLGNTIEEIAKTKSGIIKSGAYVVSSAQPAEALEVLKEKADSTADAFKSYGTDFEVLESTPDILGQKVTIRTLAGEYAELNLPVHGYYQAENAALAIAAVEAFLGGGQQDLGAPCRCGQQQAGQQQAASPEGVDREEGHP